MTAPQTTSASYEVGYRKPPRHTQFQKGQSGNPGGRPRRPARRLDELALYEAYRATIVMEDGRAVPMPAIQAVLRSQLQSAAGGNVRAQRDILAMIRDIEVVRSIFGPFESGGADDVVDDTDDTDDADAIDGDDDDVDDTADADRYDAGGATDDSDAEFAEPLSPPPGPLKRADPRSSRGQALPPAEPRYSEGSATQQSDRSRQQPTSVGGGEEPTAPPAVNAPPPEDAAAPPAGRKPALPSGSGSGQRRGVIGVRSRLNGAANSSPPPAETAYTRVSATELSDRNRQQPISIGGRESTRPNLTPRRRGVRRRRSPAVNAGKIREGHCGSSRRSPGRTNGGPGPAQAPGGHVRTPAAPSERDEKLRTRC
jgi:hypothetical protein